MGFNTVPGYLFPSPLNKTKHRRVKLNQNQEEDLEEEEQKQADGSVQKRIKSNKKCATRKGNKNYLFHSRQLSLSVFGPFFPPSPFLLLHY